MLSSQDYVFDHISGKETDLKTESKLPPKPNSEKAAKLSESVKTQTRTPDPDAVRHITYRDVQLFFNLNLF